MTVLAHLSDPHLDGTEESAARAHRAVAHLAGLPGRVDAVLITGDIVDRGTAEEYHQAREVLAPLYERHEVLLCPGNHDSRAPYREVLLGGGDGGGGSGSGGGDDGGGGTAPVNEVRDVGGVRVLMCDSSVPGRPEGLLEAATLSWLDDALAAAPDRPAFVALHHPPVPLGLPYIDRIGLREPDALAKVLARHAQVVAVLCGHAHTAAATSFAGLPLLCAPGIASTALLPWEQGPDASWKTHGAPPALAFHLYEEGRLTSHVRAV
ncbi:phosphodiesterase [Streptomyces sp. SID3915]|uniref:phosphodiesterase n=1 Tax=Streptomyces sp. SID3915 TaxID=2690263 RepID=UPI001367B1E1|nr:phosphodiesterase [Streptomyces sp. SID3915]MYX73831.1 phosphodiesterase [Streptomyces sp. SID3915]